MSVSLSSQGVADRWSASNAQRAPVVPQPGIRRALGWLLGAAAILLLMLFYNVVSDAVDRADMRRLQQRADVERHMRCAALPPSSRELCMLTAATPAYEGRRESAAPADAALLSARLQ